MENAPHIILTGTNIPPEIKEKHRKWREEVYVSLYMKLAGYVGIDHLEITKRALDYPGDVTIHHGKNRHTFVEMLKNPDRNAMQRDRDVTFYRMEWVWHDAYALLRSFRNDSASPESTIVEGAPIIHLEGYRVPPSEQEKYEQWFMRWASRIYIPVLMESPGLKAYNCLKLSDLSVRWLGRRYLQVEIPPYISMLYFENVEALQSYQSSLKYAWFKRSMEVELPSTVTKIWNVAYQLRKSFRR